MRRDHANCTSFMEKKCTKLGLAESHCVSEDSLEHHLKLAARARNDLQDLRGRGMLLSRLRPLAGQKGDWLLQIGKHLALPMPRSAA